MANTYGDDTEPGIITEESSAESVITADEAPSNICIVGPADLANASNPATENTVYEITRDSTAKDRFGPASSSLLTTAIIDQLREGANPVYAIVPGSTNVTGEDLSSLTSTSSALANDPATEDPADTTFVIDGTTKTTLITEEDPHTLSPGTDEVYFNPSTGKFELDAAPGDADSTNDTVDYTHLDYNAAFTELENNQDAKEAVDFLAAIQENPGVQDGVHSTVDSMAADNHYATGFITPDSPRIDVSTFTNSYDSSRLQLIYPTRFADGSSALAAYGGKRAFLGLDRTAIRQKLKTDKELAVSLSKAERGTLINENVVPLENRVGGAVIKDDPTTVQDGNTDEENIRYGFKRLTLDYVYDVAERNEEPFIGRLHNQAVRNALADLISDQLVGMKDSQIIEAYNVRIFEETATKARLELDVDAPDPLRFVENDVRIGDFE